MATRMIAQMNQGHMCFAREMARGGNVSLVSVILRGAGMVSGGTRDFVHDPPSRALDRMTNESPTGLRIATLAAVYQAFEALDNWKIRSLRRSCPQDPLLQDLTPSSWPLFLGPSDGVVPVSSQDPNSTELHFPGFVHSAGMVKLNFAGPTIISNGAVAEYVIGLLNTSKSAPGLYDCFPASMCSQ